MGLFLSFFFGFGPMLLFAGMVNWLDRYEKEPIRLLGGVFTWGAVVAAGLAYIINTVFGLGFYILTNSINAAEFTTSSVIAPFVEESLKGFAVLLVYLAVRQEFDSILDGIIYAAIVALGFAATENTIYIYEKGYLVNGMSGLISMVFVRVILVGWQHPFYTAFTGIGLAVSRLSGNDVVRIFAPLVGWTAAVFTHAVHNILSTMVIGPEGLVVTSFFDWSGWLAMLAFTIVMLYRDKRCLTRQLKEEVDLSIVKPDQYKTACSAWAQEFARIRAFIDGNYRVTRQFYQICGELAHKKQQFQTLREEKDREEIERLRSELARLSPLVG
jgi:protease PrsW